MGPFASFRQGFAASLLAIYIGIGAVACKPVPPTPPLPSPTPTPEPTPSPTVTPTPAPTPVPTPTPPPLIGRKELGLARLYNGLLVKTEFLPEAGEATAAVDRKDPTSYTVEVSVKVRVPKPSETLEEIALNTPQLPHLLYGLPQMLETAKVSPGYATLYSNKLSWNRNRLNQLDELLTRHNFFDCDTLLELEYPPTGRRVLFGQGDMDVNTDGSDGDRNVTVDDSSPTFQPQTSYRWARLTDRPNPFIEKSERRLREIQNDSSKAASVEILQNRIRELKRFSFLVSDADPFIVLPGFMLRDKTSPEAPRLGDYAIVIYENRLYPAIVGDAGPSFKWGEGSMRLCRELDAKASGFRRPVSSLQVTYLVFPGTADPFTQPNLDTWHDRCLALLNEIGGSPVELHRWQNVVKPWPTPTPAPTPPPTPTATPVVPPEPSPSPTATESPSSQVATPSSIEPNPAAPSPQEVLVTPTPPVK